MRDVGARLISVGSFGLAAIRVARAIGSLCAFARLGAVLALLTLAFFPTASWALSPGCTAINSNSSNFNQTFTLGGTPAFFSVDNTSFSAGEVVTYSYTGQVGSIPQAVYRPGLGTLVDIFPRVLLTSVTSASGSYTFQGNETRFLVRAAGNDGNGNNATVGASVTFSGIACSDPTAATPTLAVDFVNSGTNYAGLTATYSLTPRNTGTGATSGAITASLTLPAGLSFNSVSGSGWNCSAFPSCSYSPSIAAGGSGSALTVVYRIAGTATGSLSPGVTLSGGGASNSPSATSSTPITAPSITGFSPSSISAAGGAAVTITGAGFSTSGNTLSIGGTNITPTSQSATSIGFTAPAGLTVGTPTVIVTNSGGGSASSNGLTVTSTPVLGVSVFQNGNIFRQGGTGTFRVTPSATAANTSGTLTFTSN